MLSRDGLPPFTDYNSGVLTRPRVRAAMIALFTISGVLHFLAPAPFISIVPPWMPRADLLVAVSGAAELAGAAGLAWPRTRYWAGWGLIALLIAVFPANIQMLVNAVNASAAPWWQIALTMRLVLQPVLIWLVWYAKVPS